MTCTAKANAYTFYSYKGGSGRTTTALNTTKHLVEILGATKEKPILMVDADLESAGLTYFFNCEKRFTSVFDDSVHTNKIFEGIAAFDCDNSSGRRLFGIANEATDKVSAETKKQLTQLLVKQGYPVSQDVVDAVFGDVSLTLKKCAMFKKIVAAVYSGVFAEEEDCKNYELFSAIRMQYSNHSVTNLAKRVIGIDREELSVRDKKEKKSKAINDFLPAVEFVDVSEYFNCEEGTVKFLGVDVRFDEEQIIRNGSDEIISKFLETCGKENYAAVIFDSGAGVQSSAHILHSVSDVLVYCFRPAIQFLKGTVQQLDHYKKTLAEICSLKDEGKKTVVLLPTAVPNSDDNNLLCRLNFTKIATQVNAYTNFTDISFCKREESLNEVELFKWNECILGTNGPANEDDTAFANESLVKYLSLFSDEKTMPEDAKQAYKVYRKLAEKLVENT